MSKNVEINYKNEGGDYEVLYPKTTGDMVQVSGSHEGSLNVVLDSLLAPELVITTTPGASVTATCDKGGVSGNADDNGSLVLQLPYYGSYTVVASLLGLSKQEVVNIDAVKQYSVSIVMTNIFEELSWSSINTLLSQGNTTVFNIGDVKTFYLNGQINEDYSYNNTLAYATIIGINHNASREGNNRLHLQLALNNTNSIVVVANGMNRSPENNGGWTNCQVRTTICENIFNCLPNDFQNVIKSTTKYTSAGNNSSNIVSTSDKIFIPSEFEIHGQITQSVSGEASYQEQYEWYKTNSKLKNYRNGSGGIGAVTTWWHRSPCTNTTYAFCCTDTLQRAVGNNANEKRGIAPCVCV